MTAAAQPFLDAAQRISASAEALGQAIDAVRIYTEPAVARVSSGVMRIFIRARCYRIVIATCRLPGS